MGLQRVAVGEQLVVQLRLLLGRNLFVVAQRGAHSVDSLDAADLELIGAARLEVNEVGRLLERLLQLRLRGWREARSAAVEVNECVVLLRREDRPEARHLALRLFSVLVDCAGNLGLLALCHHSRNAALQAARDGLDVVCNRRALLGRQRLKSLGADFVDALAEQCAGLTRVHFTSRDAALKFIVGVVQVVRGLRENQGGIGALLGLGNLVLLARFSLPALVDHITHLRDGLPQLRSRTPRGGRVLRGDALPAGRDRAPAQVVDAWKARHQFTPAFFEPSYLPHIEPAVLRTVPAIW